MSEVKVNKISPRSGTEVTLGDSGDTFTIPSGATINNQGTATNFGATGSASWVTTVKTSTFTAVAGEGYFVNTTGGAVTVNLPAGVAGAVVAIKDYAGTFDTNEVTVAPNGSDKIAGNNTVDATLTTEGIAVTLVFVDSTQGWLVTDSGLQSEAPSASYIAATGGNTTLTVCSHKVHIFTGPGTLCVSAVGNPSGSNTVEYMVVAGGGGGASCSPGANSGMGGGGAGGWRGFTALPTSSPLVAPAALPVSVQGYPITVGGGGPGGSISGTHDGTNGNNSIFSTITSTAGGGGGYGCGPSRKGSDGGSGGGTGRDGPGGISSGNTPPTTPAQGEPGGDSVSGPYGGAGGGGGASAAGGNGSTGNSNPTETGGVGGLGAHISDAFFGPTASSYGTPGPTGSSRYFAGGGGAGIYCAGTAGAGGSGGGGAGSRNSPGGVTATAGTVNTGGGGGGGGNGGQGGSGIVVIRYKFQN